MTDRAACARRGRSLAETVARAINTKAPPVILLREKDLDRAPRRELALQLRLILDPVGGRLIIASDAALAAELGAGLHLAAADAGPGQPPDIVGRSCHGADDVRRAAAEGCEYVTVSPVFASASKPGYGPALGLEIFAALRARGLPAQCPDAGCAPPLVYALGGVVPGRAGDCIRAGAQGVAVMGAVMGSPHPDVTTAELIKEMAAAGPGQAYGGGL